MPRDSTERVRSSASGARTKPDIYTMLLIIALVAIVIACVFLFLELRAYQYDVNSSAGAVGWTLPTPAAAVETVQPLVAQDAPSFA